MIGYGCQADHFINISKRPEQFSAAELKAEVMARASMDLDIHPSFQILAHMCVTNSVYLHMEQNSDVAKPWKSRSVTLVGDAVFKFVSMFHSINLFYSPTKVVSKSIY